jgi:hypothetical protein
VLGISLSLRFVAIQFDDGRLKLHSISRMTSTATTDVNDGTDDNREPQPPPGSATDDLQGDERFFPDPAHPEWISAFTLTEELLANRRAAHQCVRPEAVGHGGVRSFGAHQPTKTKRWRQ